MPADETNAPHPLSAPGSVAVVGSAGRMGSMLMRRCAAAGVGASGLDRPLDDLSPLEGAELVVLCVPAAVLETALAAVCPRMRPDATLSDITSVKCGPISQMLAAWPGEVVGTHPLFGPKTCEGEPPVAMVRTRRTSDAAWALVEGFYETLGFTTFETDADTHDRAMARIQNMNFITSLAYFAQTATDETLARFITPSFRRRLDAARKLLTEDAPMFSGLFEANPYSQAAVRQFSRMLSLASAGELDLLLSRARRWWPDAE